MEMPLYAQLKKKGVEHELAMRVCELGVAHKMRLIVSWGLCGRRRMMEMGLSAAQSGTLLSILNSTRTPALTSSGNEIVLLEERQQQVDESDDVSINEIQVGGNKAM